MTFLCERLFENGVSSIDAEVLFADLLTDLADCCV